MKSRLLHPFFAALLAVTGFALLPLSAEAGGSRCFSHKCGGCGGSIYKKRVIVHRDRCGRPVHRWVRLSHRCAPVRPPSCSHGHGHGYSSSNKVHPTEIIFPILNFIASQKAPPSFASRSGGPPPAPVPSASRDPYGYTPQGSGKGDITSRPENSGKPYNSPSGTREYRY